MKFVITSRRSLLFFFIFYSFLYLLLYYFSMHSAPDRSNYLYFFSSLSVESRFEFGFNILRIIFLNLGLSAHIILLLLAFSSIFFTWVAYVRIVSGNLILVFSGFILTTFALCSDIFSAQLRTAVALSLCLYALAIIYNKNNNLISLLLFFIASSLHIAVIPFILVVLATFLFKVKIGVYTLLGIFFTGLVLLILPIIINFSIIGDYYLQYFDGRITRPRLVSISMIFYILLFMFNTFFVRLKDNRLYQVSFGGIFILIIASYYRIDGLYRMIYPFITISLFIAINSVSHFAKYDKILITFVSFIFWPILFFYFLNKLNI